jgi:hypothetical protein
LLNFIVNKIVKKSQESKIWIQVKEGKKMQESEDPYSRYYVQRAGHFFSKSTKILNIFSKYFTLCNLTLTKSKSEREIFLFVDVMDILLSEKNDKDIIINLKKNNLTITTSERILLISDLLYMKVQNSLPYSQIKLEEN